MVTISAQRVPQINPQPTGRSMPRRSSDLPFIQGAAFALPVSLILWLVLILTAIRLV